MSEECGVCRASILSEGEDVSLGNSNRETVKTERLTKYVNISGRNSNDENE